MLSRLNPFFFALDRLERSSLERLLIIELENACGERANTLMFVAPKVKLFPFPDSEGAKLVAEFVGPLFFLGLFSLLVFGDCSPFFCFFACFGT